MADPAINALAQQLAQSNQKFYQQDPFINAAQNMQPIQVAPWQKNDPWQAAAIGLQGVARGFLQGYGINNARQQQGQYASGIAQALQRPGGVYDLAKDPMYGDIAPQLMLQDYYAKQELANKQAEMQAQNQNAIALEQNKAFMGYYFSPQGQALARAGMLQMPGMPTGAPAAPGSAPGVPPQTPGVQSPVGALGGDTQGGIVPLSQRIQKKAEELLLSGLNPDEAYKAAERTYGAEQAQTEAELKALQDIKQKAANLRRIGETVLSTYDKVGYSGPGNSILTLGAGALAAMGNSDQQSKLRAQTVMDSIKPDVIKEARTVGGGAVSDYESRMFVASGPNSGQRPEANRLLGDLYTERANLADDYANFKESYYQKYGTLHGSEEKWNTYIGDFKLLDADQQGNPVINTAEKRGDWRAVLSDSPRPQATPPQAPLAPSSGQAPIAPESDQKAAFLQQGAGGGLPPGLSQAVMKVESGGNPNAASDKGAIGTHQVTPIAYRDVMRSQGIDDRQYSDAQLSQMLKQPGVSQQIGEAYLALRIQAQGGDIRKALTAYHSGDSNVANGTLGPRGREYADKVLSNLPPAAQGPAPGSGLPPPITPPAPNLAGMSGATTTPTTSPGETPVPPAANPIPSALQGGLQAARQFAQGSTLGTSDEIIAGLRSLMGKDYDTELANERAALAQGQEQHPYASMALQGVGGIATGAARGVPLLGRIAAPAATKIGQLGKAALQGAGIGAAYGAGTGEGGQDRFNRATEGGAFGAVAGPALQATGMGIAGLAKTKPIQKVLSAIPEVGKGESGKITLAGRKPNIPTISAEEAYLTRYPKHELERALQTLKEAKKTNTPVALAEAAESPGLERLTRAVTQDARDATNQSNVSKYFKLRQESASSRLLDALDQVAPEKSTDELGQAFTQGVKGLKSDIQEKIRNATASEYKAMQREVLDTPEINRLIKEEPLIQKSINAMRGRIGRTLGGQKLSKLPDNSFTVLQQVTKDLGRAAKAASKEPSLAEDAALYTSLRKRLTSAMENAGNNIKEVNALYRQEKEVFNRYFGKNDPRGLLREFLDIDEGTAQTVGAKLFRKSPDQIRVIRDSLGKKYRKEFLAGVRSHLQDVIEKQGDTPVSALKKILGSPRARDQFEAALGTTKVYDKLKSMLELEERMAKGGAFYRGGSPTIEKGQDADLLKGGAETALKVATSGKSGLLRMGAKAVDYFTQERTPKDVEVLRGLSRILLNANRQGEKSTQNVLNYIAAKTARDARYGAAAKSAADISTLAAIFEKNRR